MFILYTYFLFLVCVPCRKVVGGICEIHGNPMDALPKTMAVLSLPGTMSIQTSLLPGAGLGVFSLVVFEAGSLFGPMVGEKLTPEQHEERGNNEYVWEVPFFFFNDLGGRLHLYFPDLNLTLLAVL